MDVASYVVSWPLNVAGIVLNAFFSFCLLTTPSDGKETFKQPLKVLLVSLVGFNSLLQMTMIVSLVLVFFPQSPDVRIAKVFIFLIATFSTMASCVWLSILYFIRIVPAQSNLAIWIKRNEKPVIFSMMILNEIFLILEICVPNALPAPQIALNSTSASSNMTKSDRGVMRARLTVTVQTMHVLYLFFYVGTMSVSWGRTLAYLCTHIKQAEMSSSAFSSPHLKNQLRVTILGIVQTGLHVFCSVMLIVDLMFLTSAPLPEYFLWTGVSCFSFGTTIDLGLSQSLIRKRAAEMIHQSCRSQAK